MLASLLALLYVFRAKLGLGRLIQIFVASTTILVVVATVVVEYTDFGQMFDRLAETSETEDGLPATRALVWEIAWDNIKEKPLLGHGPRLVGQHELKSIKVPPEQLVGPEPHNLYLHLLVTVGVVGMLCMLNFLFGVAWRVYQGAKKGLFGGEYERGWVLVGIIVIGAFFIDELKIEFLRNTTVDYAHFVFALFGIFLGWADTARVEARSANIMPRTRRATPSIVADI